MKKVVTVEGMKCAGCANAVKSKFEGVDGIQNVTINLDDNSALVESETDVTTDALSSALADTGYTVTSVTRA
ncbi:heavy-metal-associated domain-containing protein [Atopococcus tabaci]|uniref:heavy-metal-associated domain-containing protein n=1 Tax=Atopococcus tabaci TaxID=269774 RepID=UPI000416898B|nr:heavy metal-associated domain-containing protein [Atopococcus tabaci]